MKTKVGVAIGPCTANLLCQKEYAPDYVEIPFEQIDKNIEPITKLGNVDKILHCASLSLLSFEQPLNELVQRVKNAATTINSPWIGEHISLCNAIDANGNKIPAGFSFAPVMNGYSLENAINNIISLKTEFTQPLILENPPQYFNYNESTMDVSTFTNELLEACNSGLLLDLSHLYISCKNLGLDVKKTLLSFPLDRLVEVHMSGVSYREGNFWDDHSSPISKDVYAMLDIVLSESEPQAVTLEYNWAPFELGHQLATDLEKVKSIVRNKSCAL